MIKERTNQFIFDRRLEAMRAKASVVREEAAKDAAKREIEL